MENSREKKKISGHETGFTLPAFTFIVGLIVAAGTFLNPREHPAPVQKRDPAAATISNPRKQTPQVFVASSTAETQKPIQETTTPLQNKKMGKSGAVRKKSVVEKKETKKSTGAATSIEEKKVSTKVGAVLPVLPLPLPPPAPQKLEPQPSQAGTPAPALLSEKELNETVRKTIVNVYCTTKTSGPFNPATGSGVIIHPSGVILTNAHVAQYYLLKDYRQKDFITCFIRTGSPARITYRAEPLYISQRWIAANPDINKQDDEPTGNSDFALLRITERVDADLALPDAFPYLPLELDDSPVRVGDSAVVVSYPAGFLEGLSIQNNLFLSSAAVTIKKLFGFSDNAFDVFSIGGSVVAQQGSSGGAVARQKSGKLAGIITLSTVGENTDSRDLRALTLSHINRAFKKETGINLDDLLAKGDFPTLAQQFNTEIAPTLTKTLVDGLKK